jgi:nitrate reductase (cytochrome), electron transfer subunit
MSRAGTPDTDRPLRVVLTAAAVVSIAAIVLGVGSRGGGGSAGEGSGVPGAGETGEATPWPGDPQWWRGPSEDPIAAEAQVFRTHELRLATEPSGGRRSAAHPRTLATYRALRAYPGAPPRIPHGLTADEYRTGACRMCHERGGYSARFGAYVPVSPHPELTECLQCHVGDDAVMGVSAPTAGAPDALCRQCHATRAAPVPRGALDWRPAPWPELAVARGAEPDVGPPPIPHDMQLRGDCLACHAGPAAVAEIRTGHPERANCRQCHTAALADEIYSRPSKTSEQDSGGQP